MKRDMELVRGILLAMESHPDGMAPSDLSVPGYSREQIGYHAYLMKDAGLITGVEKTHLNDRTPFVLPVRMTWAGHEFLDAAKDPGVWSKTKDRVSRVGGAAFPVWVKMLTEAALEIMK